MSPCVSRVIWLRGWLSKRRSRHRKGGQNYHNKKGEEKGEQISSTKGKTGLSFRLRSMAREGRNDRPQPRSCYCWGKCLGAGSLFPDQVSRSCIRVLGWNRKVQRTSFLRGCGRTKGKERLNALQMVTYFSALLLIAIRLLYVRQLCDYSVVLLPSGKETKRSSSSWSSFSSSRAYSTLCRQTATYVIDSMTGTEHAKQTTQQENRRKWKFPRTTRRERRSRRERRGET